MQAEIAVICSRADPAGLNIFESLLELVEWQRDEGFFSFQSFRLLAHEGKQTALTGVDEWLSGIGLEPELIVFPSRHVAKSAIPWIGGHFTGIVQDGAATLSTASAWGLRSFLSGLELPGFAISAEATHHGPVDVRTPCFFAEIGSTEREWTDRRPGLAVARAILGLQDGPRDPPVFLGFGGGHYVSRQTELILGSGASFGHLFSNYQIEGIDREVVEAAIDSSSATYVYLDRKSLRSNERKRLEGIVAETGLPLLRSREIRERFPMR